MGSNKDSDDIRQYLPDLDSIRREADPAVAERKLQQALNNPELDRALTEMQQQTTTSGKVLFQFPVVPAMPKGQTAPHGAVPQHGAVPAQHGAGPQHSATAPRGAAIPQGTAAQPGVMAPSQWADRALPPIDKSLLPSSLLRQTAPPVATPKPPDAAPATTERRRGTPWWVVALLAVLALSMPFVTWMIVRRGAPGDERQPALPSSGAPARRGVAPAPPSASELPTPAPTEVVDGEPSGAPDQVEPSLEDVAGEGDPPAATPRAPARPAPRRPQAPAAPVPAEQPQNEDWME